MEYNFDWNLPEDIINKFGLKDSGMHTGQSFVQCARIFSISEIEKVYVMECGDDGLPKLDTTVDVLFMRANIEKSNRRGSVTITREFLYEITKEDFIKWINEQIKINNF